MARLSIPEQLRDPNLLRNRPHLWSIYINGARDMLLRLREYFLLEEPHSGEAKKVTAEDKVIKKAIIDLILSSKENADRFLMEEYQIRLTDRVYDKKGKLIKCRAYFAKRVAIYREVK